jgi:hypothetical protein
VTSTYQLYSIFQWFFVLKFFQLKCCTVHNFVISVRSVTCPAHLIPLSNFVIFLWITYRVRTDTRTNLIKGQFTICVTFPFRHRSIFVPSEWSVSTLSVMFSHVPKQYMIGGLRYFLQICSPIRFLRDSSQQ